MNSILESVIVFCACLFLVSAGTYFGIYLESRGIVNQCDFPIEGIDGVAGTGSMLPLVRPDTLFSFDVLNETDELLCGHDYVYKKEDGGRVIHQFVYENEKGELFFKGYNNAGYDEPITREQVIWHVTDYHFGGNYNETI